MGERARDAVDRATTVCNTCAGMLPTDVDSFVADVRTQWAAEMGLIWIGETVNRIPAEVPQRFPA